MRDRILAILRDKQIAHPELLADEIVAAIVGDERGKLAVRWSDEHKKVIYYLPGDMLESELISDMFGVKREMNATEELELRGYDITTLRFEIRRKEA